MGLLSFLTRKSTSDRVPGRLIKTQAYDATVAAHPPVRGSPGNEHCVAFKTDQTLGTYPVAGNGPNLLDKLQQAAKKRSTAQLPVAVPSTVDTLNDFDTFDSYTAPSPQIPRSRDSFIGRPTTAPGPGLKPRSKSLNRSSRGSSPTVALRPDSDFIQKELLPPVPSIPPQHRRRRSSLDSANRFIDILDAQGEFKPYNFRSRVEAAGAREYGEDVADRNIGVNSHDLSNPAVQAFYAGSQGTYFDESAPAPAISTGGYSKSERSIRRSRKKSATSLAKTADISAWNSFSECHEVDMLRPEYPEYPRGRRIERRAELYYANAGNDGSSLVEDRRKSFHTFAPRSTEQSRPRPLSLRPSKASFHDDELYLPPMPRLRPKTSGERSEVHSIGTLDVQSMVDEAFDEPAPFPSMHTITTPQTKTNLGVAGIPGRPRHNRRRSRSESYDWQAQSKHREPTLALSRPSSSSSIDPSRPRTGSQGGSSLQQRHRLDDITEHIPVRTSSLGLNSQPCFTPTTVSSVYSSNAAFTKPRSQHTPSTSVDASMAGLSETLVYDHELSPSVSSVRHQSPAHHAAEDDFGLDALGVPRSKIQNQSRVEYQDLPIGDSLLMSNYISGFTDDSDVDSFVGTRGRTGGEEELLFNEGIYRASGGLPGLFDSFPSQKVPALLPNQRSTRPTSMSSHKPVQKKRQDHPRPRSVQTRPPSRSHKSYESQHEFTIDAGDLDAFLELQHEFLRSAGPMMAAIGADDRHGRRSKYEFDDDDEDKVDIQTATRIRKDLKKTDTTRSLRSRRSRSTMYQRRREEESGHAADTED